jgi:hypothetical protein
VTGTAESLHLLCPSNTPLLPNNTQKVTSHEPGRLHKRATSESSRNPKLVSKPAPQLLLDSEGIDAYNQTAQDGVQLLSLAVLLSSMFVFNQMGPIDEAAIDRLGLVTEVGGARVTPAGDAAGNVAVGTGDAVAMLQRAREWRGWGR